MADYRIIYVTEAHPTDGWHFPVDSCAKPEFAEVQHARSTADRLANANRFVTGLGVEPSLVLVDSIEDTLEQAYEARPERLYVIQGGRVLWRCGLGPFEYDPDGLEAFLATLGTS